MKKEYRGKSFYLSKATINFIEKETKAKAKERSVDISSSKTLEEMIYELQDLRKLLLSK